jgi:hypothetical protein
MNNTLKTVINILFKAIIANLVGYIVARLYKAVRIK